MIFDRGAKTIQWGKDTLQLLVMGKLDVHVQKKEVGLLPNTTYKN